MRPLPAGRSECCCCDSVSGAGGTSANQRQKSSSIDFLLNRERPLISTFVNEKLHHCSFQFHFIILFKCSCAAVLYCTVYTLQYSSSGRCTSVHTRPIAYRNGELDASHRPLLLTIIGATSGISLDMWALVCVLFHLNARTRQALCHSCRPQMFCRALLAVLVTRHELCVLLVNRTLTCIADSCCY